MPTLNYKDAGALVEYDYLQGTIVALYPEDDTADVSGVCGVLSGVPVFYHCDPESVLRSNGAIEGAASGFSVGDLVVVLKGRGEASSLGEKYYVVGHYDGVKPCTAPGILWIEAYAGFWDFGTSTSREVKRQFAWDLRTNDYADFLSRVDTENGGTRLIRKDEWPLSVDIAIFGETIEYRFGRMTKFKPSFVVESQCLCIADGLSFNDLKVIPGDFIWQTHNPSVWSRVKSVFSSMIQSESLVVTGDMIGLNHLGFTVSSSLPMLTKTRVEYAVEPNWVFTGTIAGNDYVEATSLFVRSYDVINNVNTEILVPYSSPATGFLRLHSEDWPNYLQYTNYGIITLTTDWTETFGGNIQPEYVEYGGTNIRYIAPKPSVSRFEYEYDPLSGPAPITPTNIRTEFTPMGIEQWTVVDGMFLVTPTDGYGGSEYEPPTDGVWELFYDRTLDIPYGDSSRFCRAWCTDKYAWQHHVFHEYESNILAQCVKRGSPTSAISTARSSALEAAILKLIEDTRLYDEWLHPIYPPAPAPISILGIYMKYYSETRAVQGPFDMLSMINGVRGYSDLMTEDTELMSGCQEKVDYFIANSICSHANPPVPSGVEECISVTGWVDGAEIAVAGWMSSPHHAAVIMDPTVDVLGWACGNYPDDIQSLTLGAGMFDAETGTYTTSEQTIDFTGMPSQYLKCWVLQLKSKD